MNEKLKAKGQKEKIIADVYHNITRVNTSTDEAILQQLLRLHQEWRPSKLQIVAPGNSDCSSWIKVLVVSPESHVDRRVCCLAHVSVQCILANACNGCFYRCETYLISNRS